MAFNGCCVNPIAGAVLHNRYSISGFFEKLTLNSTTETFNVPGHAFRPVSAVFRVFLSCRSMLFLLSTTELLQECHIVYGAFRFKP